MCETCKWSKWRDDTIVVRIHSIVEAAAVADSPGRDLTSTGCTFLVTVCVHVTHWLLSRLGCCMDPEPFSITSVTSISSSSLQFWALLATNGVALGLALVVVLDLGLV